MPDNLHRERLRTAESGGGAGSATAISATNERAVVKSRLRRVLAAIVAPADNHCNHVHGIGAPDAFPAVLEALRAAKSSHGT
jgi:hypothetical protein